MNEEELINIITFLNYKMSLEQFRKIISYVRISDIFIEREYVTIKIYLKEPKSNFGSINIKIIDLEKGG